MKQLTQEDIQLIKDNDIEQHLRTVLRCQYKRNTMRKQNDIVVDILNAMGYSYKKDYVCNVCIFNIYLELAKIYFNQPKNVEKVVEITERYSVSGSSEDTGTNKQSVTRKKKNEGGPKNKKTKK